MHSGADGMIPFADSQELARNSGNIAIEIGTDHRLAETETLAVILKAFEEENLQ